MLEPWHDFFTLIGSAPATLVGLMFVAASVGAGVFTEERQVGLRTFLSPTVVAFSVVLATSLAGLLPLPDERLSGVLFAGTGLWGVFYSIAIGRRMRREGLAKALDLDDRIWYMLAPACAYAVLVAAGAALILKASPALPVLATSLGLLLLAGLRNAWDMTTWVVLRRRS
jgi:hypothetical protein